MNATMRINIETGTVEIETDDPHAHFNIAVVSGMDVTYYKPDEITIHEPQEYLDM
jgi:hypothetical protein